MHAICDFHPCPPPLDSIYWAASQLTPPSHSRLADPVRERSKIHKLKLAEPTRTTSTSSARLLPSSTSGLPKRSRFEPLINDGPCHRVNVSKLAASQPINTGVVSSLSITLAGPIPFSHDRTSIPSTSAISQLPRLYCTYIMHLHAFMLQLPSLLSSHCSLHAVLVSALPLPSPVASAYPGRCYP